MTTHDSVYATAGWGIHDERWVSAMRSVGFAPAVVSLGRDAHDPDGLRALVGGLASSGEPVLAGPIGSVTRPLAGQPIRLIGLSWGYDLDDLDRSGEDLAWLAGLDGLVVDSAANRAIAERAGLSAGRITFLPWGVDLSLFSPDGPRMTAEDLGLASGTRIVLSLRAHEPRYRVGDILDAFAQSCSPDLSLVIGHGGSLTQALQSQAERLGVADRTRFIGTVPEDGLPALLRGAAIYVTASEVDGTSVTLLQAMACRTPVIASATPGNLQWIEPGVTGLTFTPADPSAIAAALDQALTMDTSPMTAKGRERVTADADWAANLPRLAHALASVP